MVANQRNKASCPIYKSRELHVRADFRHADEVLLAYAFGRDASDYHDLVADL